MPNLYDSDDEEAPVFGLNKTFAAAYQTKKQTEELSKLQDKYGKDYTLSDEESEEEDLSDDDSDAELVTPQVDVAILRTLAKIRNKDPAVYEDGRQVFDEEESGVASSSTSVQQPKALTSKPVLLKDYQRSRMLADPTFSLSDSAPDSSFIPTFAQEELALKAEVKKAFLGDDDGSDGEDDLLVKRSKTKDERQREDEEYEAFLKTNAGDRAVEDALEQEEKFLRDYILNRGWIDRSGNKSRIPSYNEITGGDDEDDAPSAEKKVKKVKKSKVVVPDDALASGNDDNETIPDPGAHDSEDSEFEEIAEEFEHKYNFRFEEAAGPTMVTHARNALSTVRRPTAVVSARARARESAKEKKEEEKRERKEEVRRLKALKRKEVEAKLLKLVEAAGEGTAGLEALDLEGDWDPEEHDRKMAEVYGQEYGEIEDADFKPTWDDDIDITDLQGAEGSDGEGVPSAMEIEEEAYDPSESSKKSKKKDKKRKRDEEGFPTELLEAAKNGGDEARKKLLDSMVDEYYGLDYEDKIGDLPTRFKYAKVAPSSFALTPTEILLATDAELNSYMSLRKMAPYRHGDSDEKKSGKNKKRLKELRDALKHRKWGEEIVEGAEGEGRERKKIKWSEENGRKKGKGGEEGEGEEGKSGVKRVGKSERKRMKKAQAEAAAAAGAVVAEE